MKNNQAPYLVLCKVCKKHGPFSLPSGKLTEEFYTVEKALDIIEEFHRQAVLHGSEASMLDDQVKRSGVEPFDYFVVDVLVKYPSLLDEMEKAPEDEEEIMEFLTEHHEFKKGNCIS